MMFYILPHDNVKRKLHAMWYCHIMRCLRLKKWSGTKVDCGKGCLPVLKVLVMPSPELAHIDGASDSDIEKTLYRTRAVKYCNLQDSRSSTEVILSNRISNTKWATKIDDSWCKSFTMCFHYMFMIMWLYINDYIIKMHKNPQINLCHLRQCICQCLSSIMREHIVSKIYWYSTKPELHWVLSY